VPNLVKYTYELLPLEQHHKIGGKKKKTKRTAGSRALNCFSENRQSMNSKNTPKNRRFS
jgi:hypothetical protein